LRQNPRELAFLGGQNELAQVGQVKVHGSMIDVIASAFGFSEALVSNLEIVQLPGCGDNAIDSAL